jgi:acyl-coenzyme A synthetase/AMP-(fatty) acid ligase
MPAGEPGELWIGGTPVALSDVNRPDLTQAAFRSFADDRCYATGDLVRVVQEGLLYLGRKDDQVKIRGVRIELGEVEHALNQHPAVGQAVAVAVETPDRASLELVAGCTRGITASGPLPDLAQLRDFLGTRLPSAFVPSATLAG